MASERLDLLIFGASSYTGKHVVSLLARSGNSYPGMTWGVAGRSRDKLLNTLQAAAKNTELNVSNVKIIVADVEDEDSLKLMAEQTRVLLNCCGPYVRLGEAVVAAAIAARAHYLDVSGERQFIKSLELNYDKPARDAGVYVINACGLTSVPADLGVIFLERNFGGILNSVESYVVCRTPRAKMLETLRHGVVTYSCWQAVINNWAQMSLKDLQQQENQTHLHPQLKSRYLIHKNINKWSLPFPTSDSSVVSRTQRHLHKSQNKRPVQFRNHLTFTSMFTAILAILAFAIFYSMIKIKCIRKFILKYPRLCSFGLVTYSDPKEGLLNEGLFQYVLVGNGWDKDDDVSKAPAKRVTARVTVSGESPAYNGTAATFLNCAISILTEREKMPVMGGVYTAGVACGNTTIIQRLQQNYFTFEILHK